MTSRKRGRPSLGNGKLQHVGFRCGQEDVQLFEHAAEIEQRTLSNWIRKTLLNALLNQVGESK